MKQYWIHSFKMEEQFPIKSEYWFPLIRVVKKNSVSAGLVFFFEVAMRQMVVASTALMACNPSI